MDSTNPRELNLGSLATRGAVLWVWLPMLVIAAVHYGSPHHLHWPHDLARRAFYVPIILAGTMAGWRGGVLAASVAIAIYVPHGWGFVVAHDPGSSSEKLFEVVFYVVLGLIAGLVAERSRDEQARQAELVGQLQVSLRELKAKDSQLERASRLNALGQLTAGLAHEIRNPLHAMRGTAEILLDVVPDEAEERGMAEALIAEIDRLAAVLQRFLDFARTREADVAPVRLDEIVQRVEELVRASAARQSTRLVTQLQPDALVMGDAEQLVQVVLGMAINALQALEGEGTVWLRSIGSPGGCAIEIANDGPAIPPEVLDRLFDPFFSTRAGGTGLGLAVAWRIMEAQGGRIEVEQPEGTVVFRVCLPTQVGPAE